MSREIVPAAGEFTKTRVKKGLKGLRTTRTVLSAGLVFLVCAVWWCGLARAQAQDGVTPGTAGQAAAKAGKEKEETCRVSGMVVKLVDGTPLKNATVRLENEEDHEHTIAVKTGADGRFALKNVPAARYKLKIRRNGYVDYEYGQTKPSDPGATFLLSAGENRHDLLFKLIPGAVISGRVFDEDGEIVSGAIVMASREVYHQGKRTLSSQWAARTDDLGQFRLFALAPGRYYVSAMDSNYWGDVAGDREFNADRKKTETGYAKTYYPGTVDFSKAATISLKEGEEVPGVDIQLKQIAVYRVGGRVFNAITHKAASGSDTYVQLIARNKRLEWDFSGGEPVRKQNGEFEIAKVIPGSYLLMAYWGEQGKYYSTQEKLEVGESDVEGISLTIGLSAPIAGRVRWEGKPSLERDQLSIGLQPADVPFNWDVPARVENLQFALKDVGDGDFDVLVVGASKDCYVKDLEYGGTHYPDNKISVNKGAGGQLEITISSRGARVQGAVVDKDGLPATGVWVVAVPDEARRTNLKLFKSQTTDQYGKYDLHGLAPGTYRIFSWTGIEQGEWEDTEFLRPQEGKGELLEVQDEDVKTVNLKVIEKKSVGTE